MFPIINIGPLAIQAAGLILLISLWIGTWLSGLLSENLGTNDDVIENSILLGLIIGLLGARVGFFIQNPSVFINNPLNLVALSPSMLDTGFGLLVGLLTIYIISQNKHLPALPTLDSISPLLVVMFAGVHLANYANGNDFGLPTDLPWGVQLWGADRHPVQLYTLLLTAGFFIAFLMRTHKLKQTGFLRSGNLFLMTIAALATITVFTRAFVAQKTLVGGLDFVQVLAFLVMTGSLCAIYFRSFQNRDQVPVLISMGSNTEPAEHLSMALDKIKSAFNVQQMSGVYQTEDVKNQTSKSQYLNRIVEINTSLAFIDLVEKLKSIEKELGRQSREKSVVPIDLDVLTYDGDVFTEKGWQIPNPDLIKYRYLAQPLAEMNPGFRHPASGVSIQNIVDRIENNANVEKIDGTDNGIKE